MVRSQPVQMDERRDSVLKRLLARSERCETGDDRWALIAEAWQTYCRGGASAFDWDYESRDLMDALMGPTVDED